jgi:hypothetical protein
MSISTNQVGLSITKDKVQLVEVNSRDGKLYLENVDEEFFEESIDDKTKEAKFIHILQNAFNEIVLRKPLSSSKINISLPPSYFKTIELPVDKNLTKNDLNDYIKWELTKLFPNYSSDFFTFDKIVLNSLNFSEVKRVLVFALPKLLLKQIHKFCSRNNLVLKLIDNAQIAIDNFVKASDGKQENFTFYLENNFLSVLLTSKNSIISESHLEFSSISTLSEEIKTITNKMLENATLKTKIQDVYMFGSMVSNELKKSVSEQLEFTINEIDPFYKLVVPIDFENSAYLENSFKFASATAMAVRKTK